MDEFGGEYFGWLAFGLGLRPQCITALLHTWLALYDYFCFQTCEFHGSCHFARHIARDCSRRFEAIFRAFGG
jgi:hypothetical protein